MIKLVYVSSASEELSKQELIKILEQSRSRNKAANITGMLLYLNGNIIQVLEGEKANVEAVYHSIQRDKRNRGHIVLQKETIIERAFPFWSMGFRDVTSDNMANTTGFSEFINRKMKPSEFASREDEIIDLLYSFKEDNA